MSRRISIKKSTMCPVCGTVLTVENESDDLLECLPPEGFEWALPAGKITDPAGRIWYIDAFGKRFTRDDYITKYQLDPEVALQNMRRQRNVIKIGYSR